MTTLRPGEAKGWLQAVRHEHWLMMDAERRVTGCVCGYVASEDDCGYGDGTVMHIVAAAYPAIARAVAIGIADQCDHMWRSADRADNGSEYTHGCMDALAQCADVARSYVKEDQ